MRGAAHSLTMTSASDYPLRLLRPENQLHGFAVWQMLSVLRAADGNLTVGNQPQAKDYRPDEPQTVSMLWGDCPLADGYRYILNVILTDGDFNKQPANLMVCETSKLDDGYYWVCESTYELPLGRMMELLTRLDEYGEQILPCLEVSYVNEGAWSAQGDDE